MMQSYYSPSLKTILHIGVVPKDNWCVKWCTSTDFIIDIALSMILKFHFLYSQPGHKGKYYYSPAQFSIAIGYGASG